ncbi:MAG: DUF4167 domain-containing protein [Hyphomicrobiales bacterium]
MRQHNNKNNNNNRSRGRGGRKGPNPLTRSYESNGPDVKVRGTAQHVAEKYQTLARDALSAGDGISAEAYYQYAEHYNRIIMTAQTQQNAAREEERRNAAQAQENREQSNKDATPVAQDGPQPVVAEGPRAEKSADNARDKEQPKPRRGRGSNRPPRQTEVQANASVASDENKSSAKEKPDPIKEKPDNIMDNPPAFLMSD